MTTEEVTETLFEQANLRRQSYEKAAAQNTYNRARLAYMAGAVDSLELVLELLELWDIYLNWRAENGKQ